MNLKADHERLLADALTDSAPAGFREAMLQQTLRLARRRRRFRQTRHGAIVLISLCAVAVLLWKSSSRHLSAPRFSSPGYELVHTQPLPAEAMITTRPLTADSLVASVATATIVHSNDGIRELNDDELLALVGLKPAALVRVGPHTAELIFAHPEDQKGFPLE